MNTEEFLEEVKSSGLYTDAFAADYQDFQRFQDMAWETLLAFHEVCETSGIHYQLAFGSLLGAIRDGGQIPWDYDVDVFVPGEEREKLLQALQEQLSEHYNIECAELNPKCSNELIRVAPKPFGTEALHLDVFFLIGTPEDDEEFRTYTKRIRELCKIRFTTYMNVRTDVHGKLRRRLYYLARKIPYAFKSAAKAHVEYLEKIKQYSVYKMSRAVNANSYCGTYFMPSEYLRETILFPVGENELRVTKEYDALLKYLFQDYTQTPPMDSRLQEIQKYLQPLRRSERKALRQSAKNTKSLERATH